MDEHIKIFAKLLQSKKKKNALMHDKEEIKIELQFQGESLQTLILSNSWQEASRIHQKTQSFVILKNMQIRLTSQLLTNSSKMKRWMRTSSQNYLHCSIQGRLRCISKKAF